MDAYSANNNSPLSLSEGFYEIEYDAGPLSQAGKCILKPRPIAPPAKDEVRELFGQMRDIAREYRSHYNYNRFFDRRVQHENAAIFYKQALFMKDFTDDYNKTTPFSQYFPNYQMMGYEQLRTYFTWRAQVRKGDVSDTSLSYAFLYIYELLANIGVDNPQEGLRQLLEFWRAFTVFNSSIDRYVIRWLKDYHIYYNIAPSFNDFVRAQGLEKHYPQTVAAGDDFALFSAVSKYDIRKSAYCTDETKEMMADCFSYVMEAVRQGFEAAGIRFDDAFFRPNKRVTAWKPFKDALFYDWLKQPTRQVVLSAHEIYLCRNNKWTGSTYITSEKGRQFIGYVMKRMEAELRRLTDYKHKINAPLDMVHEETIRKLEKAGFFVDQAVPAAVREFYREMTKTVVTVDFSALARIRQEAQATQEALRVEEQQSPENQNLFADEAPELEAVALTDGWAGLKDILSENELQSLAIILQDGDLKAFADECGIMLEVLIDGINEKAMDCLGDSLIDGEFMLYDDYREQTKEIVK
ncbi:MAG: TerB N-terminal domain-containing protein [Lachnospiraceae bacterium]|jgi:hypothetical protein|nr:TerB N-terminal domain-containing protein [Lachnospiraceae bacterium]